MLQQHTMEWQSLRSYSEYFIQNEKVFSVTSHLALQNLIDTNIKFHEHFRLIVNIANGLTFNLQKFTLNQSGKFVI